ncbi:MAG: hypothetical protein MUE37_12015 [Bacteroidales bacterium]|nr:hypothetical protein [Bacteroidales bacterium]
MPSVTSRKRRSAGSRPSPVTCASSTISGGTNRTLFIASAGASGGGGATGGAGGLNRSGSGMAITFILSPGIAST